MNLIVNFHVLPKNVQVKSNFYLWLQLSMKFSFIPFYTDHNKKGNYITENKWPNMKKIHIYTH